MVFHREVFVIADVRGRVLGRLVQGLCTVTLVALCSNPLFAQGTLALSSGTAAANGNATLNLTLTSPAGSEPAGIQWTLTYSPTDIVSISAIAGTSGTAAGKSITCAASSGSYMCLLVGLNTNVMQNGVAAVVSVTISPGVASTTINVTNTLGATAAAAALPINGVGGIVTSGAPPVTGIRAMSCLPASLSTGGSATCTVSLNTAAPAGGATVSLSSYAAALTVPNSVTVGAGNTTVTFTATAGTISTDQLATLMATLNGTTQAATISLVAPATLSGLACIPASLGSGGSSTCTVTVSKTGGATVSLSRNTAALTVPASVTVGSGSTTATFTATAGTITSDQTAILTATLNGSTQATAISLTTPVTLGGLTCAPASLGSGGSSTCTVTVSKTGGATVTLSSNAASLTVPASVTVGSGSTTATFTAAAGTVTSDQTATLTATLSSTTLTTTIALATPPTLSGLTCTPASLGAGGSSTCTATVSKTGGAVVSLSSNAAALTVPASVTVGSGNTTATFTATAGTITSDQTGTVTATLNGGMATATIALATAPAVSGLTCTPASLGSGGSSTCTVTVSKTGGATVSLSSNAAALAVPASVTVGSGGTTGTFTATAGMIAADQTATLTATLNGTSQTATISLGAATGTSAISSLACSPDPNSTGTLLCTVYLTQAAPLNGTTVSLQSNSARVQVPSSLVVPAGSQSATFTAPVSASDQDEQPQLTASVQGAVRTTSPTIIGIRPTALACSTSAIQAGNWLDCVIQLNSPNIPEVARLVVSSANPALKTPDTIVSRPGQTRLRFLLYADPYATEKSSNIAVQFGETLVNYAVYVTPSSAPVLSIPENVNTVFGKQVNFIFAAVDPRGLTVVLSASGLPDGASFDPGTGAFSWTPTQAQQGVYSITLSATNSATASSTGQIGITVDSGKPIITDVFNAASWRGPACSPGSVASLAGRWLASVNTPASNPSGTLTELAGTRVRVNGEYVSVLYASPTRVDFVCPDTASGTRLTIAVEDEAGIADPVLTIMNQTTPGLYSFDGTGGGQGLITLAGTSVLAASRDYRALGQPAEPGDSIAIRTTGITTLDGALPMVSIGDVYADVQSVQAVPGMAGVYEITAVVPLGLQDGDAVPVVVTLPLDRLHPWRGPLDAGNIRRFGVQSNQTTIAVERSRP